jgi:hypothetical protein
MTSYVTDHYCYDVDPDSTTSDPYWGTNFFFGGPGWNLQCE